MICFIFCIKHINSCFHLRSIFLEILLRELLIKRIRTSLNYVRFERKHQIKPNIYLLHLIMLVIYRLDKIRSLLQTKYNTD